MEIRRTTQTSKIPFETETREVPQQPTTSRGVAETTDSFVTGTEQNPLSVLDTSVQQATDKQSPPAQFATDDSLQKQLQMGLNQANIFQLPKPKLDFGDVSVPLIRLSTVTGKSVEELKALFNKYGLDPNNLPKPPNSQVAALLNDPALDSTLTGLKANVASSYGELEDHINSAKSAANSINSSNIASDTSVYDNLDLSPFKFLNDAYHHNDPYSKALGQARNQLGERTAGLLSAMYPGVEIKLFSSTGGGSPSSIEDAVLEKWKEETGGQQSSHEGAIQFGNTLLNPCTNSTTGQIQFSNSAAVDWPYVQRIPWYYDHEGDAATNPPSWMVADGYPRVAYDN
jgi:hypothetical protein